MSQEQGSSSMQEINFSMDDVRGKLPVDEADWHPNNTLATRTSLTVAAEVNTTVSVIQLATELRSLARRAWGENGYDGVIVGIGELDNPNFAIAVPVKPFAEVIVAMDGEAYVAAGKEIEVCRLVEKGKNINAEPLALPDIKAFSAKVAQAVARGSFANLSPYIRKSPRK